MSWILSQCTSSVLLQYTYIHTHTLTLSLSHINLKIFQNSKGPCYTLSTKKSYYLQTKWLLILCYQAELDILKFYKIAESLYNRKSDTQMEHTLAELTSCYVSVSLPPQACSSEIADQPAALLSACSSIHNGLALSLHE